MSWSKLLQPDLMLGESILGLDLPTLQNQNLRGLVLDVDETLVPIQATEVSHEVRQWIEALRPHLSIWLVSNNLSQARIRRIAKHLDTPYIFGARKPSRRRLRQALEAMNLPAEQVGMVGDRLFTDVLVGNRLGMFTILVEPMLPPAATPRRNLVRDLEVYLSQVLGASFPK